MVTWRIEVMVELPETIDKAQLEAAVKMLLDQGRSPYTVTAIEKVQEIRIGG